MVGGWRSEEGEVSGVSWSWIYRVVLRGVVVLWFSLVERCVRRHCFSRSSRKVFGLVEFYVVVGLVEDVMLVWEMEEEEMSDSEFQIPDSIDRVTPLLFFIQIFGHGSQQQDSSSPPSLVTALLLFIKLNQEQ